MRQGTSTVVVVVTVEVKSENGLAHYFHFETWRGMTVSQIRRAARAKHGKGTSLQFGKPLWSTSYGAH